MHAAQLLGQAVAVDPRGMAELRALHDHLRELDARAGVDVAHDDVDARAQAEDEPRVGAVQDQIPAGQEHLAWGGDSSSHG